MTMRPKIAALLILGLLLLIILLQNTEVASFQILFWKLTMSRIILIPLMALVGGIIGFFIGKKSRD